MWFCKKSFTKAERSFASGEARALFVVVANRVCCMKPSQSLHEHPQDAFDLCICYQTCYHGNSPYIELQ